MIQYAYPRLDINVSKGMNHLLKSPFCVHPKTGKICIPFTANTVDKFQPDKVPTITTLIEEVNEYELKDKAEQQAYDLNAKKIKDYKKTSLNKSLRLFQEFLWKLETERKGQKIQESGMYSPIVWNLYLFLYIFFIFQTQKWSFELGNEISIIIKVRIQYYLIVYFERIYK